MTIRTKFGTVFGYSIKKITMKKIYTLFSVLLCIILLSSCTKPILDENNVFLGSWGSEKFSIEIWKDGFGKIKRVRLYENETMVIIKDNSIKFKTTGFSKKFRVDSEPYVDNDGITVMILDGKSSTSIRVIANDKYIN